MVTSSEDFLIVSSYLLHTYKFCQQSGLWLLCCTYTVMHATNGRQYYADDREWGDTSHITYTQEPVKTKEKYYITQQKVQKKYFKAISCIKRVSMCVHIKCGHFKHVSPHLNGLRHFPSLSFKLLHTGKGKSIPIQVYYRQRGFQEVGDPRFQDSGNMKVARLSALHTSCLYPPPGIIPGTHLLRGCVDSRTTVKPEGMMSTKNSNDAIRNRTRDLLTRTAVPQPTTPPCA